MTKGTPPYYLALADAADDAQPETFVAFAARIDMSRPYVSKRVGDGTIHGDALVTHGGKRLIAPALALRQLAAASAAPDAPSATTDPTAHAPAYATARARKTEADAAAAELDLDIKRGLYIERRTAGPAIAGFFREVRDAIILAIREHPHRPEDAVHEVFADKAARLPHVLTEGAAPPGG